MNYHIGEVIEELTAPITHKLLCTFSVIEMVPVRILNHKSLPTKLTPILLVKGAVATLSVIVQMFLPCKACTTGIRTNIALLSLFHFSSILTFLPFTSW